MITEKINGFPAGLEPDLGCPGVGSLIKFHVTPLLIGNQVTDIAGTAVRGTIIHPPDPTTIGDASRLEFYTDGKLACLKA